MGQKRRFTIQVLAAVTGIVLLAVIILLFLGSSNRVTDISISSESTEEVGQSNLYRSYTEPGRTYRSNRAVPAVTYYSDKDYDDDYDDYDYEDCNRYDRYGYCVEYDNNKDYDYDNDYNDYYNRERNYGDYYGYDRYDRYRDNSDDEERNEFKYSKTLEKPFDFSEDSRVNRYSALFGNDVDDFEVYVYNEEEVGGYFEVTYIFEDAYGREKKYSETKYVRPGKDIKFFYRDVTPHYSEYQNVRYEVKSLSKVPYGTSYN